jgi:o-succinylbenzoate---CoA ligase
MQQHWVKFNSDQFFLEDIQKGYYPKSISSYKKIALDFCRDWLNGKEKFTLHTSGSTGDPKAIEFTRNQLEASARLTASVLGLQKDFTSLVCLDTRYTAGMMMLVRSLVSGMNMIIVEPASNPLEKISESDSIDFAAMVPLQVETILKSPTKKNLNEIKIVLIGGAELSHKTAKALAPLKASFFATYGMTETLSHIALQKLNGKDAQDFFQALPGIALSKDERDCLTILAPHISDKVIITNDLVEFVSPTQFRWLGRADNVINTGGVKVIPEKIEAMIGELLDEMKISRRFFVAAIPHPALGESVNLFFEGEPLPVLTEELIRKKIDGSLDRFQRPRSIHYVEKFIVTGTGKINKGRTIDLTEG